MSGNDKANGDASTCKHCGETFGNAGARGKHEATCDAATEADPLTAGELDRVRSANANVLEATLNEHDFKAADGDTVETAVAKCLIRADSGGREAYADTFGTCSIDGCEYGANGYERMTCKRHEPDASGDSDDSDEADATREAPEHDGMDVIADLLEDDVPPAKAAAAVEAADSVTVPDSWAGVYGGVLDRVASSTKAKAAADALRGDGE